MKTFFKIPVILLPALLVVNPGTLKSTASTILVPFATGLNHPVCIANAGDSRLFVVNQEGYIHIITPGGTVNPLPFLDIHARVQYGGEEGLLGVAFHPQYISNGYFYVNYIGAGDSTHISRFNVSAGNPDIADPLSEFKLMTIYQPYPNHKGGDLNFGPDGYLYIGLGDGGSGGDPGNRAQNPMEYLGKMLRIDVNQGNPYAIPPSNPFYNSTNTLKEIWALGLRNPWRFSFDRLTGDLWIADVGQNLIEEIDLQPAASTGGENYGWRCYEGNQPYNSTGCAPFSSFTFPVYTYPHGEECSVTGGYRYRGNPSSLWYGYYFFTDYCSDRIWTLHYESGSWVKENFGRFTGNNFSTFGEDSSGQIYIAGITSGIIWKLDLTIPPDTIVNGTVANGESPCIDAISTITVGGTASSFVVDQGGNSTMIAGQNIIYSQNTRVMPGGYMHGYISTGNQYCPAKSPSSGPTAVHRGTGTMDSMQSFNIYPNPTSGTFMIREMNRIPGGTVKVEVSGMFGKRVLSEVFHGDRVHEISLAGNLPGMYLIKISTGAGSEAHKLVLTP